MFYLYVAGYHIVIGPYASIWDAERAIESIEREEPDMAVGLAPNGNLDNWYLNYDLLSAKELAEKGTQTITSYFDD
jgi:hypothetical protein